MSQGQLEVTDVLGRRIVTIERDPFTLGRGGRQRPAPAKCRGISRPRGDRQRGGRVRHQGTVGRDTAPTSTTTPSRSGLWCTVTGFVSAAAEVPRSSSSCRGPTRRSSGVVGRSATSKQVAALLEGLRALSSARVLDDVLTLVMDSAIDVSGAERGFIMLANEAAQLEFTMGRSRARKNAARERLRNEPEDSRGSVHDREGADRGPISWMAIWPTSTWGTIALGIRNVLCVALRLVRYTDQATAPAEDRRIGVLYLDSREKGTLLSSPTAAALENPGERGRGGHRERQALSHGAGEGKARAGNADGGRDPTGAASRPPSNRIVLRRCGGNAAMPVDRRRLLRLHRPA